MHFASVAAYGPRCLGREVLDRVFARGLGAEVRRPCALQIVSGNHNANRLSPLRRAQAWGRGCWPPPAALSNLEE